MVDGVCGGRDGRNIGRAFRLQLAPRCYLLETPPAHGVAPRTSASDLVRNYALCNYPHPMPRRKQTEFRQVTSGCSSGVGDQSLQGVEKNRGRALLDHCSGIIWREPVGSPALGSLARSHEVSHLLSGHRGQCAPVRLAPGRGGALSALSGWYFFFEPRNSFLLREPNAIYALIGFLLVGGFLLILVAGMADLIRRLEAANQVQVSLFGELQHRVANNLQIVLAMISNARRGVLDATAAERIAAAEDRIAAMSALHRRLYDKTTYEQGLAPILQETLRNFKRRCAMILATCRSSCRWIYPRTQNCRWIR